MKAFFSSLLLLSFPTASRDFANSSLFLFPIHWEKIIKFKWKNLTYRRNSIYFRCDQYLESKDKWLNCSPSTQLARLPWFFPFSLRIALVAVSTKLDQSISPGSGTGMGNFSAAEVLSCCFWACWIRLVECWGEFVTLGDNLKYKNQIWVYQSK